MNKKKMFLLKHEQDNGIAELTAWEKQTSRRCCRAWAMADRGGSSFSRWMPCTKRNVFVKFCDAVNSLDRHGPNSWDHFWWLRTLKLLVLVGPSRLPLSGLRGLLIVDSSPWSLPWYFSRRAVRPGAFFSR